MVFLLIGPGRLVRTRGLLMKILFLRSVGADIVADRRWASPGREPVAKKGRRSISRLEASHHVGGTRWIGWVVWGMRSVGIHDVFLPGEKKFFAYTMREHSSGPVDWEGRLLIFDVVVACGRHQPHQIMKVRRTNCASRRVGEDAERLRGCLSSKTRIARGGAPW